MIYTSPIDSISWQEVEDFLNQGTSENAYLEYKVDWPTALERTIAAMANTLGGVILLGVDEDDNGKPKYPPVGVPFERGLSERVMNIVVSNVTPPVFPDVAVCPNGDNKRALVVIRVPQSHQTPHATMNNRRVYLRTGNRNNPEELATVGEIEWLRERRALSIGLRQNMYANAIHRSDVFLDYVFRTPQGRVKQVVQPPYMILCASPYYPTKPFTTPPNLKPTVRDIRVRDYYGTDHEFPISAERIRLLQDGVYLLATGPRSYYTEFNISGQIFYRQTLLYELDNAWQVRATEVIARLDQFLRVAKRYLDKLGHQGLVWFSLLLGSVARSTLLEWAPGEPDSVAGPCEDEAISFEQTLSMADWDAQYEDIVVQAAQKVAWAYDWELPPQVVQHYLAKHRRI